MIDEQFSRQWTAGHSAFSADLANALDAVSQRVANGFRQLRSIGKAYAHPALHGVAAVVSTLVLFVTIGMVAFPEPLHAASLHSEQVAGQCQPVIELA